MAGSTTPLRSDRPEAGWDHPEASGDRPAASGISGTPRPSRPPVGRVTALVSRVLGWLFFVGGIVGAVLGIAGLHVEITVAGLILACTAGLVLLKLRADTDAASGGAETDPAA